MRGFPGWPRCDSLLRMTIRGSVDGHAITVTNETRSAADLRALASREKDAEVVRRLLAVAMVVEGKSRTEAAEQNGMQRQTLRDWVHRYNAEDVAGLKSRHSPGRAPALAPAQMEELRALVINGPDPETDGVVRWRCVDLRRRVKRQFAVDVHVRTIGKWLRRLRMTRLQPRPFHPRQDAAAQAAFKKTSAI